MSTHFKYVQLAVNIFYLLSLCVNCREFSVNICNAWKNVFTLKIAFFSFFQIKVSWFRRGLNALTKIGKRDSDDKNVTETLIDSIQFDSNGMFEIWTLLFSNLVFYYHFFFLLVFDWILGYFHGLLFAFEFAFLFENCVYINLCFLLDKNNKDQPRLGSRRNTFSQPIITDKGDGTHDVSYVPPPVGDPYEVGYPQYLSIPTSWPSSIKDTPNIMLKLALFSMHCIWHKAYFSSNPIKENFSSCPSAFLASELLSLIFVPNITHFKDWSFLIFFHAHWKYE